MGTVLRDVDSRQRCGLSSRPSVVWTVLRGGDSPQGSGESSGVGTVIRHGDWSEVRKVNSYIWGVSSGVGTVVNHAEDCGKR